MRQIKSHSSGSFAWRSLHLEVGACVAGDVRMEPEPQKTMTRSYEFGGKHAIGKLDFRMR
jgi:hypothetical protein